VINKLSKYRISFIVFLLLLTSCSLMRNRGIQQKQNIPKEREIYDPEALEHFLNGELYYLNSQYAQAILEYQDALKHDSTSTTIYMQLGRSYLKLGKIESATELLQQAKKIDPDDREIRKLLAHLYLVSDNSQKSLQEYKYLYEQNPDDIDISYKYAGLLIKEKEDHKQVQKILKNVLAQDPDQLPALEELAKIQLEKGNIDSASTLFDRLIDLDPENERYLRIRARIAIGSKNIQKATQLYEKLIEINPEEEAYGETLSRLLMNTDNFDQTEKFLKELISRYPEKTTHYLNLAILYRNNDKYETALSTLDSASTHFPDNSDIPYLKGTIYYYQGFGEKATEYLQKALKFNQNHTEAAHMLANNWDQLQQYDKSDSLYKELIQKNPEDAIALNNLAYSLAQRATNLDSALNYVNRALKLRPDNPSYLDTKGWVYYKLNKPREAAKWIKKALEKIDNGNAEIYQHLGEIYLKLKNEKAAQKYFEEAKRLENKN